MMKSFHNSTETLYSAKWLKLTKITYTDETNKIRVNNKYNKHFNQNRLGKVQNAQLVENVRLMELVYWQF